MFIKNTADVGALCYIKSAVSKEQGHPNWQVQFAGSKIMPYFNAVSLNAAVSHYEDCEWTVHMDYVSLKYLIRSFEQTRSIF